MKKLVLSMAAWAADALPDAWIKQLYNVKPLAGLVRKILNIAAPVGNAEVTIAGGHLQGWRISLDMQSEKDYWLGTYETELQEAIQDHVRAGMVAYDIGANIGYISLILAKVVGRDGKVFAFEALPQNFERLAGNIAINAKEQCISAHALAVADTSGIKRFIPGPSGGMGKLENSAGRPAPSSAVISVKCISLDDFVYQDGHVTPDVVKMDIEGGEVLALPGMRRVLRDHKPLMFIELHGQQAAKIAWEELTSIGYVIQHMRKGYPRVRSWEALAWKSYIIARFMRDEINA